MRRNIVARIGNRIARLAAREAAPGIVLIVCAAAAIGLANSSWHDFYHDLFHARLAWSPVPALPTLHHWINDGLMAVFFLVVGLEIKRELLDGELSTPARRRLPVIAALSGMALPAAVYLLAGGASGEYLRGWAIPAATDIAFALGVLALVGSRVPRSLRLFLLSVAIIDDLGAVMVIALFYTASINLAWLAGAGAVFAGLLVLGRTRAWAPLLFAAGAVLLWLCVLQSGVHATIAGVLAAFAVPLRLDAKGDSPLLRIEHALVGYNAFVIVPLFGLANAGVAVTGLAELAAPLPLAIALGLLVGKQAGIFGAIVLADRTGLASRPAGASWLQVWGVALLCGIGFTMSLFIAALAFPGQADLVDQAKLGVLVGSVVSALAGFALLRFAPTRR